MKEIKRNNQSKDEDIFGSSKPGVNAEEVRVGGKIGSVTATVGEILSTSDTKTVEEAELDMLRLAADQINNKQYRGALSLLSNIRSKLESTRHFIRRVATLIGLERYKDAEIHALLAHFNGESSIANFINLASLSAMRKDQLMAKKWLGLAEKIDRKNEMVIQCKELLFPEGKSREEDRPFD